MSSLGDLVWEDTNKDGIQDSGEDGIANVTVELHKCADNSLVNTTTTDMNGNYLFTNITAGQYFVHFDLPSGYDFSPAVQGSDTTKDSNADQSTGNSACVTLAAGEVNTTVDAGIFTNKFADLSVVKTSSVQEPGIGDNVTYTITVTNNGPDDAHNIILNDLLPAGESFVSYSASQGTYDNLSGVWNAGDLTNGSSASLQITVQINGNTINQSTVDFGPAKGFNLFVLKDLNQPSSDTEGKMAVGHNADLAGYSVGDKLPANSGDVLIVGHTLTFASGAVYNGNAVYGVNTNLPIYPVSIAGTLRQDNPIDFDAAKTYLQNLSTTLSGHAANQTTTFQWGQLTLTGNDPFMNVFDISGSDLNASNNMVINVPNGSVVLINIGGTNDSWTGGLTVNNNATSNVIFNFYEALNLHIQGIDVRGSILAPFANLDFPTGLVTGEVIVNSMTGSGQFNNVPFCGNIPVSSQITNTAVIASSTPTDPNLNNNTSSVTVTVSPSSADTTGNTAGNGGGGNTGGNSGSGGSGNTSGSGSGWQSVCSFGNGEIVYAMASDGNNMYAGTWGGKIYQSADEGQNWTLINQSMNSASVWALNISGGYLFAATGEGVYKYDGSNWSATNISGKEVHALSSSNGTIYAGTWGYGVYVSTDNGDTWSTLNDGLGVFLSIQSIAVNDNGDVYAGTVGGGLFRLSSGGTSWQKVMDGFVWSLGTNSSGAVFAGTYGDGLYKSLDGQNWTKLTGLNVPFIYSVSSDASGKIYVSSLTSGVFVSSDNGISWSALGMGGSGVSSLVVNPASSAVYVGTKDGSVYATANSRITAVKESKAMPTQFKLEQNYPNPFNPTTTIEFALPKSGEYSLKVYNSIGQAVATVMQGSMSAGVHSVQFNASELSSGMYIYRLSGNGVNMIKKMVLMK